MTKGGSSHTKQQYLAFYFKEEFLLRAVSIKHAFLVLCKAYEETSLYDSVSNPFLNNRLF